jgi:hypothetical protein
MKYLFHTKKGSLTCCKFSRHEANGFNSPMMVSILWFFIALKNPLHLDMSEPTNLGFNGKHANH